MTEALPGRDGDDAVGSRDSQHERILAVHQVRVPAGAGQQKGPGRRYGSGDAETGVIRVERLDREGIVEYGLIRNDNFNHAAAFVRFERDFQLRI